MPPTDSVTNRLPCIPMAIVCVCACALLLLGTATAPPSSPTGAASWIWRYDAIGRPNCRVYLAKAFTVPGAAAKTIFLCTADNGYTLFVNGREVGGSRDAGDSWRRLDYHDLTELVRIGMNTLAVEARNDAGPAGFIGRMDVQLAGGGTVTVVTDESWSAALDAPDGWPGSPRLPFGKPAAALTKPPAGPWGYPKPPSRLAAALQTDLGRELILPKRIAEIQGCSEAITDAESLLKPDGKTARTELPAGERVALVLDFGREVVGYFRAKTSGGPARLDLAYGESLRECLQSRPWQPIDCRIAGPGRWEWTDPERRAFRYLKVAISECSAPLEIDYFGLDLVGYPVVNRGDFRCSDELLNRIWDTGRYTTRLCMQDFYEDGVKRDRRLWIGDLRVEMLSAYYALGDYRLAKRDLMRLADNQMSDGAVPAVGYAVNLAIFPNTFEKTWTR